MMERKLEFDINNFEFDELYYELIDTVLPLYAVKDELLTMMEAKKLTYFRIPDYMTKVRSSVIFRFVRTATEKKIIYNFIKAEYFGSR